jgi:hypothetical protein
MSRSDSLPVAVIGAGPVGLAAAAELVGRGIDTRVYEAGPDVAHSVRDWGHVRLFSPWRYNVAEAASRVLAETGWTSPDPEELPTGHDLVARYLRPLAETPELSRVIETDARVLAVARDGADKTVSADRESRPFVLTIESADGNRRRDQARAVIDASGTWGTPNPLGANGLPADGERDHAGVIAYGIPDVLDRDRTLYAGRTTLVVGAGHSAANAILDLDRLRTADPATRIVWTTRSRRIDRVLGGGTGDQLPARGELGRLLGSLVASGGVEYVPEFSTNAVRPDARGRLVVLGSTPAGPKEIGPVDRIIVATGQRPGLAMASELRLDLDPWLESVRALGPLIDPNLHSCGSVPPHGYREVSHPEPGFYTVGVKSYGRAPTFLLATGYEQVRSVAAAIAGDFAAADDVRLVLPETGVCSAPAGESAEAGCCGGPAPKETNACCVADADAKAAGKDGCGCRVAA